MSIPDEAVEAAAKAARLVQALRDRVETVKKERTMNQPVVAIPEEATQAALAALGERYGEDAYCKEREYVIVTLEAAAPHMLAGAWRLGLDAGRGVETARNPYSG